MRPSLSQGPKALKRSPTVRSIYPRPPRYFSPMIEAIPRETPCVGLPKSASTSTLGSRITIRNTSLVERLADEGHRAQRRKITPRPAQGGLHCKTLHMNELDSRLKDGTAGAKRSEIHLNPVEIRRENRVFSPLKAR